MRSSANRRQVVHRRTALFLHGDAADHREDRQPLLLAGRHLPVLLVQTGTRGVDAPPAGTCSTGSAEWPDPDTRTGKSSPADLPHGDNPSSTSMVLSGNLAAYFCGQVLEQDQQEPQSRALHVSGGDRRLHQHPGGSAVLRQDWRVREANEHQGPGKRTSSTYNADTLTCDSESQVECLRALRAQLSLRYPSVDVGRRNRIPTPAGRGVPARQAVGNVETVENRSGRTPR